MKKGLNQSVFFTVPFFSGNVVADGNRLQQSFASLIRPQALTTRPVSASPRLIIRKATEGTLKVHKRSFIVAPLALGKHLGKRFWIKKMKEMRESTPDQKAHDLVT
ncbi:hypothetical protein ACVWYG_002843 [Pedobacter sp. UYEF25]